MTRVDVFLLRVFYTSKKFQVSNVKSNTTLTDQSDCYAVASSIQRFLSGLIDLLVFSVISIILLYLYNLIRYQEIYSFGHMMGMEYNRVLLSILNTVLFLIVNWSFFREGQTLGMRFVGTQIVMKNGFKASMITVVIRQIFYSYLGMMTFIIPPILLFAINGLLLKFHPCKRLLHDLIAGTMVIQKY